MCIITKMDKLRVVCRFKTNDDRKCYKCENGISTNGLFIV